MTTWIGTKKQFVEYLANQINDDNFIVWTQELTGNLSVSKKLNQKKVSFAFAANAFSEQDGIGHFVMGKTPTVAFCICKDTDISPSKLEEINQSSQQESE